MRSTSDPDQFDTGRARWPFAAAALGWLASLALFWPGVVTYDGVAQYAQVLSDRYDDWHPPAMVRLWDLLSPLGGGAAPMLVIQLAAYWLGFGLTGGALARGGRRDAGLAVVAIGAVPVFLGWQGVMLKDAQMAGAMLGAVGLVAWWRLRRERVPVAIVASVVVLLGYATLVRANAVFATVPLAVMLAGASWSPARRALAVAAGVVAVIALSSPINHAVLDGRASGVERTQAVYDLAGIAVRVPDPASTGFTADEATALRAKDCVRAFFWDPLGEDTRCGPVTARMRARPASALYADLARAVATHPLAYAAHRLAHLDSTMRWWVPYRWPSAAPPQASEANTLGLGSPGLSAVAIQRVAGVLVETPIGWPFAWVVVAATLVLALRRVAGAARHLAVALLVSALALETSFAAISIASDLRYHLWAMIATALAAVVAGRFAERRVLLAGAGMLAILMVPAIFARATLPVSPQSYAGMLG